LNRVFRGAGGLDRYKELLCPIRTSSPVVIKPVKIGRPVTGLIAHAHAPSVAAIAISMKNRSGEVLASDKFLSKFPRTDIFNLPS